MNPTRKVLLIILGVGVLVLIVFSLIHQNPDALPTATQPPGDSGSGSLAALLVFVVGVCIYFIPTVVANNRKHRNVTAITVLNIFLGWTVLGWIIALVWACTSDVKA